MKYLATAAFLYLVVLCLIDLVLVRAAIRRAAQDQTAGRLLSLACVLAGIALSASARVVQFAPYTPPAVIVGTLLADAGLTGFAIFLPEQGLRSRLRSGSSS